MHEGCKKPNVLTHGHWEVKTAEAAKAGGGNPQPDTLHITRTYMKLVPVVVGSVWRYGFNNNLGVLGW